MDDASDLPFTLPSFPIMVLAFALITRVFVRRENERLTTRTHTRPVKERDIMILVCIPASSGWREYVNHLVMRCGEAACIHVLLTFRSADQVPDHDVTDPIYRHLVHIDMGIERSWHPSAVLHRLVRRYVSGSERTVVVLQGGCILHDDFARTVGEVARRLPTTAVASSPTAHVTGVAQFPTLRVRSNGSHARDLSKPFHRESLQHHVELVPSVTWCPEITIASGALLKRWSSEASSMKSFLELLRRMPDVPHLIPSHPLLAHNTRVEDDILDYDEGYSMDGEPVALSNAERVGLTMRSSGH